MAEQLRITCPVCGMRPRKSDWERAKENPKAEIQIYLQEFGGKAPPGSTANGPVYQKKGRGSAPGFMKWTEVTAMEPELVEEIRVLVEERIAKFQAGGA